eukprot:1154748-Pelagomonas_calceolata.AAC.3
MRKIDAGSEVQILAAHSKLQNVARVDMEIRQCRQLKVAGSWRFQGGEVQASTAAGKSCWSVSGKPFT